MQCVLSIIQFSEAGNQSSVMTVRIVLYKGSIIFQLSIIIQGSIIRQISIIIQITIIIQISIMRTKRVL